MGNENVVPTPPPSAPKFDKQDIKYKVYMEFDIIKNSNHDKLIEELKMIIGLRRFIILWSKTVLPENMLAYCIEFNLTDYIWDYKQKDSFYYESVDFIIDNDMRMVERFIRNGKEGNYIERIV